MLTCFRSRHQRERRTHLEQLHHNQNTTNRMPKGPFLSQTSGQTAIKNNKKRKYQQDIHAKTYNDRNSKPQQKHRLGTVSKNLTWGGGGGGGGAGGGGGFNRFDVATTFALSSAALSSRHFFSPGF